VRTLGIIALGIVLLIGGIVPCYSFGTEIQMEACDAKLSALVEDLDRALVSHPREITVRLLLHKHLPVEGCDIPRATEIAKRSRFFSYTSDAGGYVVIAFTSKAFEGHPGLDIQFSLVKATGASQHPFVIGHKGD
jgi:hypothetical protein